MIDRRKLLSLGVTAPFLARAASRKVRIAFLGGAHSHASGKVNVVQASSDYELVGMWPENDQVRRRYQERGVKMLKLDELLGDPSIEVIAVESAVADHARHAMTALEAGKHIHLEKPPALDVESFREIQNLAARKERIVQMGYMWRYHPGMNRILEAARKGWLGRVHLVQATIHKTLGAEDRPEWAEFRGGQMFELGGHVIDPLVRLLGRPDRVTPYLKKHGQFDDNMADNTIAVFECQGALGMVVGAAISDVGSRYRSFEVHGTNGVATMRPIEPPSLTVRLSTVAGPYAKGVNEVELPEYKRYVGDFVDLAAAVRGEKPLANTPREDLVVHEALLAASGM